MPIAIVIPLLVVFIIKDEVAAIFITLLIRKKRFWIIWAGLRMLFKFSFTAIACLTWVPFYIEHKPLPYHYTAAVVIFFSKIQPANDVPNSFLNYTNKF